MKKKRVLIYITQITTSDTFSSNKLIRLGNGLKWMFEISLKDLKKIENEKLIDKIKQFRDIQSEYGPSNLRISVNFITLGTTKKISKEFKQELAKIKDEYDNGTYQSFSIEALGCDELVNLLKMWERKTKSINENIKIRYDQNNPSLIKYDSGGLKGVVCSIPASEIARLVNNSPDGVIFDLNIRRYLGNLGKVNRDIQETSTGDESYKFWFLNNGITIVCDSFDVVSDPDTPKIKLKNLQIVNGCQTATTIAAAHKEGKLKRGIHILTRIYETEDHNLVNRIVLTTNNQNQITNRNLCANEPTQINMENAFRLYGYYYERKARQYENDEIDIEKVFNNEFVGQSYLAIVLKDPSDAHARRYMIWKDLHSNVFSEKKPIEPYIIVSLLNKQLSLWLRKSSHYKIRNSTERITARRGLFHIARIASYVWRKTDSWDSLPTMKKQIKILTENPNLLNPMFEKSFQMLLKLVESSEYKDDLERGFKSNPLDKEINRMLYGDNKVESKTAKRRLAKKK